MGSSIRDQIQSLTKQERTNWIQTLPDSVVKDLSRKPWWFIGRPEQQEPEGDWNVWLILSGRGWGKTRTGGEWLARRILENPKAPDFKVTVRSKKPQSQPKDYADQAPNEDVPF